MIYTAILFDCGVNTESWATPSYTQHQETMQNLRGRASIGSLGTKELQIFIVEYHLKALLHSKDVEVCHAITWEYQPRGQTDGVLLEVYHYSKDRGF